MKKLKNRVNLYAVVRLGDSPAVCGIFNDYNEADDHATAWKQEWLERYRINVEFMVQLSTYYG